jgi:hypothetical protein
LCQTRRSPFVPPHATNHLQELEYDEAHNPINFINKYIVLPKDFAHDDVLSFVLDKDSLDEGESGALMAARVQCAGLLCRLSKAVARLMPCLPACLPAPHTRTHTGYYKLSAKIAMITQFPDLIELEGENKIIQADSYGEDVSGTKRLVDWLNWLCW